MYITVHALEITMVSKLYYIAPTRTFATLKLQCSVANLEARDDVNYIYFFSFNYTNTCQIRLHSNKYISYAGCTSKKFDRWFTSFEKFDGVIKKSNFTWDQKRATFYAIKYRHMHRGKDRQTPSVAKKVNKYIIENFSKVL